MKNPSLFAVIDLGASAIRMVIAQQQEEKTYEIIESLSQSMRLGVDTFLTDVISPESSIATVRTLKKFKRVLDDYQVKECRLVATSAVNEAQNRDYFLDYIRRQTGLRIEAIESLEACKLIYYSVREELEKAKETIAANSLLIDLGTGNARVAFLENEKMIWNQSLKLGSLRLREILHDIDIQSFEFHKVLQAFVHADIDLMYKLNPLPKLDLLILTGSVIGDIIRYLAPHLTDKTLLKVNVEWFFQMYEKYKNVTIEEFVELHNIPLEKADVLLPALTVYWNFVSIFNPDNIILTESSLAEGVILEKFKPLANFNEHVLASARNVSAKFGSDEHHARKVTQLAEEIFLQTHSLHKLPKDYLLLLKVAGWLHDIGFFINDRQHHKHSQYLIEATPITGMTEHQRAIIAIVARNHRHYNLKLDTSSNIRFSNKEKTNITKLIAIIRIANALDKSHADSVKTVKIKYKKEKQHVLFRIITRTSVPLERWAFLHSYQLFAELFFVDCILIEKRELG